MRDQETQSAVAKKGVAARARIWQGDNAEEEVSTKISTVNIESYKRHNKTSLPTPTKATFQHAYTVDLVF